MELPRSDQSERHRLPVWAGTAVGLGVWMVVALLLRLFGFEQGLWAEEVRYSLRGVGSMPELMNSILRDAQPPVWLLFMKVWTRLLGDGETWLRLPSLLCGVASVPLVYALGARWLRRDVGMCAAAMLALSPVHAWFSGEAGPAAPGMFLLLLNLFVFAELALGKGGLLRSILYLVSLFLASFTLYATAIILAVPFFVTLVRRIGNRKKLLVINLSWASAFSVFCVGRWYLPPLDAGERAFLAIQDLPGLFGWLLTGNVLTPIVGEHWRGLGWLALVVQIMAAAMFVLGAVLRRRSGQVLRPLDLALACLAVPAGLLALSLAGVACGYSNRILLPALPLLLLVIARGVMGLRRWFGSQVWLLPGVVAGVLAMCYLQHRDRHTVEAARPDWRAIARYLGAEMDRAEPEGAGTKAWVAPRRLLVAARGAEALPYHDARIQLEDRQSIDRERISQLRRAVRHLLGDRSGLGRWLVRTAEESADRLASSRALERDGMRVSVVKLPAAQARSANVKAGPGDRVFYWLQRSTVTAPTPTLPPSLDEARFKVVSTLRVRGLDLFRLEMKPQ